jgi:site-specific DNA recombinase
MDTERKSLKQCAIYTRKSSEEGLEQSFNSLDAQREACEAFITSQHHEGLRTLTTRYDDGGYSGGSMERPALKRLLADVQAGKVNVIVVYKIDRLTRSLLDFARIIEILDARQVSFVSITQQFNTTTSMGRLTLNVLLSFAQFEREVTGERIRDKFAASKRKGWWMGGPVPLGYDLKDRHLFINQTEAKTVRTIFERYLALGGVRELRVELEKKGIRSKIRISANGNKTGGNPYSRGALYSILGNPLYIGEIHHRGQSHPGQHEAIIPRELWEKVQTQLRTNNDARRLGLKADCPSLLAGNLFDVEGTRYTPVHTSKKGRRYRYYASQAIIRGGPTAPTLPARIAAHLLEQPVAHAVENFLGHNKRSDAEKAMGSVDIRRLLARVVIAEKSLRIFLDKKAVLTVCDVPPGKAAKGSADSKHMELTAPWIAPSAMVKTAIPPVVHSAGNEALLKAVARAYTWYEALTSGKGTNVAALARGVGLHRRYAARILNCAFLSPEVVEALVEGTATTLSLERLRRSVYPSWEQQRQMWGIRRTSGRT